MEGEEPTEFEQWKIVPVQVKQSQRKQQFKHQTAGWGMHDLGIWGFCSKKEILVHDTTYPLE